MNSLSVTSLLLLLTPFLHAQAPTKPDFASLNDVTALLPGEVKKDLKQPSQIEAAQRTAPSARRISGAKEGGSPEWHGFNPQRGSLGDA
jgi:hypothetical protein